MFGIVDIRNSGPESTVADSESFQKLRFLNLPVIPRVARSPFTLFIQRTVFNFIIATGIVGLQLSSKRIH